MPSLPRTRRDSALAIGLIVACVVGEAAVLGVGIDDLDEGYFVQQALRVLHGQIPYRDFQTLYTPGLAYVHAGMFGLLGGPFVLAPRVLALAARAALALLLFVMARPLVRRPLWAALPGVFLLVGLDDAPVRWEPHPGWLSTVFAVLAAWCLSHRPSLRWLAAAGIAAAVAYVFKQNTGAYMLAAILCYAYPSPRPSPRGRGSPHDPLQGINEGSAAAVQGSGTVPGTASPSGRGREERAGEGWLPARLFVPFASFAAVTLLWLAPLVVALGGDGSQLGVLVGAVNQAGLFAAPEWPVLVPVACLVGGVWLWRAGDYTPRWYLLAGSALFLTQYPRMDAPHLVWSAPLLLVIGAVTLDRLKPLVAGLIVLGAFALTAPTITSRVQAVGQPGVPIAEDVRYAAGIAVPEQTRTDLQGLVTDIQARTNPGEPIFVYPTSPLLYALADRPNPTRFDHLNPGAADARQIEQVIGDLEAGAVRLVVISDFWTAAWGDPGPNAALDAWLASHFTEVARYGAYRVLTSGL